MNKITYVQIDNMLMIDGFPYNGNYTKIDNVHAIQWRAPDILEIEWTDGRRNTSSTGPYPHQQHIDEWGRSKAIRLSEQEVKQKSEEEELRAYQERVAKVEQLKVKVGLVFQEAGYSLDTNELHLLFNEELEDCK
jgi:hypothetical protein